MARMRIEVNGRGMKELLNSADVADGLRPFAEQVEAAARRDPNPAYVESLRITEHRSQGRQGRVSLRIGAAPWMVGGVNKERKQFGMAVEAARGTLQRALGEA